MSSQLIVDLDSLTAEKGRAYAGLILALAGFEDSETPSASPLVDPIAAFGPAAGTVANGKIDQRVLSLVIGSESAPPPPPPAVAPQNANVPAIITNSAGSVSPATLDKTGLPWDGRIHASSKATNADGTWRTKRGVDKALVDSVTAELKRALAAPGPHLVQTPPPPPAPSAQAQQAPPPPAPPAPSADERAAYVQLVGRASAAVGAGRVTQDQINKCLSALGVDNMPALGHRLDLVSAACSLIDGIIAGQSA